MRRIGAGLGCALGLALAVSLSVARVQSQDQLDPAASAKLTTVLADLATGVPQDRAGARPASAGRAVPRDTLPQSVQDALDTGTLQMDASGRVQVYVRLAVLTDETLASLAAEGAVVEAVDAAGSRVQVRVAASGLARLAGLAAVTFVRPPAYAMRHIGAFTSEGDAILGADTARADFGVDGSGIRVGVISDGLKGVFGVKCGTCDPVAGGPVSSRDLPDARGERDSNGVLQQSTGGIIGASFRADGDLEGLPGRREACAFGGAGAEGTALLEVVHDLAPGAQLSFANANTSVEFMAAVRALAAGNDVVVDDLGFFGEPGDGQSSVSVNTAAALNDPANRIRAYVTSAGNAAQNHYLGTYVDSGVDPLGLVGVTTAGRLHLFQRTDETSDVLGLGPQSYDVITLAKDAEVVIVLTWNDPAGRSSNDYNLYLVREGSRRLAARSTTVQSGQQDPIEAVDFVNRDDGGRFHILVQNAGNRAAPRTLNLFAITPECAPAGPGLLAAGRHERHNYNTPARSLPAQSDAGGTPASVISAGAICSASAAASNAVASSPSPGESCNDVRHQTIQHYSSRGPTLDGRLKPDIAGIDGVSITGAGGFPQLFFGTSAAAPHIAAIAALVLQAAPCLRSTGAGALAPASARTTLRSLLLSAAGPLPPADPSSAAPNVTFGFGRANAARAVDRARSTCAAP